MEKQPTKGGSKFRNEAPESSAILPCTEIVSSNAIWRLVRGVRIVVFAMVALTIMLSKTDLHAQSAAGRIMPLGDSITYGFNGLNYPNGSIPGGYRKQLGTRLTGAGYTYDFVGSSRANSAVGMDPDHNGFNGFRSDQVLANLTTWLAASPDIVLMHLGTNDLIQHVPLATVVNNLNSLIHQITVNTPNRRLFVATIIPIIDTRDGYTAAQWVSVIASYNNQVRSLVQSHANQGRKVTLVDMNANLVYSASNPIQRFFQPGDGTHPGQAGYNQMGDFWFDAIRSSRSPNPVLPNLLVNGSFESDYAGWTHSGNQSIHSTAPYAGAHGAKLVNFNGGNLVPNAVLAQTFPTTPGATHTLTFDAGVVAYNTKPQVLQASVIGASGLLSQSISLTGSGNGATRWSTRSFTFVANSATTTLTFRDLSASTDSLDLLIDNVQVTGSGSAQSNTAPVAVADAYPANRDAPLVIPTPGLLGNDTDAQANPLTAVLNMVPVHGSVSLNANGGFTYTPFAGYTGTDSFTYHASDGSLDSNIAKVTINVQATTATASALVNGSFESNGTGWTATGNQVIATGSPYSATHGSKLVSFNGGNNAPNGVISQSFATVAGQTLTLAFDVGVLSYNTKTQTMLVTVHGTDTLLTRSITIIGQGGGTNRWVPQSFTFIANSATTTLSFRDQSTSTQSLDLLLDNVTVTAATPAAPFNEGGTPSSRGVLSISGPPTDITISMTASASGVYSLECSEDLIVWKRIGDVKVTTPGPISFRDSHGTDGAPSARTRMFYRVAMPSGSGGD